MLKYFVFSYLPQTAVEEYKEAQQNGDFDMSAADE